METGTRMWRRGANLEGAAANFIETEQILEFKGFRSSFLQVIYSCIGSYCHERKINTLDDEFN